MNSMIGSLKPVFGEFETDDSDGVSDPSMLGLVGISSCSKNQLRSSIENEFTDSESNSLDNSKFTDQIQSIISSMDEIQNSNENFENAKFKSIDKKKESHLNLDEIYDTDAMGQNKLSDKIQTIISPIDKHPSTVENPNNDFSPSLAKKNESLETDDNSNTNSPDNYDDRANLEKSEIKSFSLIDKKKVSKKFRTLDPDEDSDNSLSQSKFSDRIQTDIALIGESENANSRDTLPTGFCENHKPCKLINSFQESNFGVKTMLSAHALFDSENGYSKSDNENLNSSARKDKVKDKKRETFVAEFEDSVVTKAALLDVENMLDIEVLSNDSGRRDSKTLQATCLDIEPYKINCPHLKTKTKLTNLDIASEFIVDTSNKFKKHDSDDDTQLSLNMSCEEQPNEPCYNNNDIVEDDPYSGVKVESEIDEETELNDEIISSATTEDSNTSIVSTDDPVLSDVTTGDQVPSSVTTVDLVPSSVTNDNPVPSSITTDNPVPSSVTTHNQVPTSVTTDDLVSSGRTTDDSRSESLIKYQKGRTEQENINFTFGIYPNLPTRQAFSQGIGTLNNTNNVKVQPKLGKGVSIVVNKNSAIHTSKCNERSNDTNLEVNSGSTRLIDQKYLEQLKSSSSYSLKTQQNMATCFVDKQIIQRSSQNSLEQDVDKSLCDAASSSIVPTVEHDPEHVVYNQSLLTPSHRSNSNQDLIGAGKSENSANVDRSKPRRLVAIVDTFKPNIHSSSNKHFIPVLKNVVFPNVNTKLTFSENCQTSGSVSGNNNLQINSKVNRERISSTTANSKGTITEKKLFLYSVAYWNNSFESSQKTDIFQPMDKGRDNQIGDVEKGDKVGKIERGDQISKIGRRDKKCGTLESESNYRCKLKTCNCCDKEFRHSDETSSERKTPPQTKFIDMAKPRKNNTKAKKKRLEGKIFSRQVLDCAKIDHNYSVSDDFTGSNSIATFECTKNQYCAYMEHSYSEFNCLGGFFPQPNYNKDAFKEENNGMQLRIGAVFSLASVVADDSDYCLPKQTMPFHCLPGMNDVKILKYACQDKLLSKQCYVVLNTLQTMNSRISGFGTVCSRSCREAVVNKFELARQRNLFKRKQYIIKSGARKPTGMVSNKKNRSLRIIMKEKDFKTTRKKKDVKIKKKERKQKHNYVKEEQESYRIKQVKNREKRQKKKYINNEKESVSINQKKNLQCTKSKPLGIDGENSDHFCNPQDKIEHTKVAIQKPVITVENNKTKPDVKMVSLLNMSAMNQVIVKPEPVAIGYGDETESCSLQQEVESGPLEEETSDEEVQSGNLRTMCNKRPHETSESVTVGEPSDKIRRLKELLRVQEDAVNEMRKRITMQSAT